MATDRLPKIDEPVFVMVGKAWFKGKIIGIVHDDTEVLVQCDGVGGKTIKCWASRIMFGTDPKRPPEPGVD